MMTFRVIKHGRNQRGSCVCVDGGGGGGGRGGGGGGGFAGSVKPSFDSKFHVHGKFV